MSGKLVTLFRLQETNPIHVMNLKVALVASVLTGTAFADFSADPVDGKNRRNSVLRGSSTTPAAGTQPSERQSRRGSPFPGLSQLFQKQVTASPVSCATGGFVFVTPVPDPSREQGSSLEQGSHGAPHR